MAIQRWDPFRDLRMVEDSMNRFLRGYSPVAAGNEEWNIAIDVLQRGDEIVVKASVPGVNPDGIDLAIEDNILTIRAERKSDFENGQAEYLIQERPMGMFYRALRLPDTVDAEKIQSSYENGVLTIVLPKAEEKKRKQIKIEVGSGSKAIEAK